MSRFACRSKSVLTDCDAKEARSGVPLAAFRVSSQLFWVLQEHGYEDETQTVTVKSRRSNSFSRDEHPTLGESRHLQRFQRVSPSGEHRVVAESTETYRSMGPRSTVLI